MKQKRTWHFNMPQTVKTILKDLEQKAETKSCVEVEDVKKLIKELSWTSLPIVLDKALSLVGVPSKMNNRMLPLWIDVPSNIELLKIRVHTLDCRSLQSTNKQEEVQPKDISNIKLVEYDAEEDLTGDNESVDITVYFEDASGDEIPNVGVKLYVDEEMMEPLVDYKGAFYFIRPSQPEEKVTMLVRGTGTVKQTKFEVQ